jgi:hypothetical protein
VSSLLSVVYHVLSIVLSSLTAVMFCEMIDLMSFCGIIKSFSSSRLIGSEVGTFSKVSVSDCDETKARCILKRGTNATVTIEFKISKSEMCLSFSSFCEVCPN